VDLLVRTSECFAGIHFYEALVADQVLLGYTIKQESPAFAVLWVRAKPGLRPAWSACSEASGP
jgi:hypothetical protein